MPKISQKGIDMPASPIRKLADYAEEAKKRSVKVYHLNIGQPDIETPREALDAIATFSNKIIKYGHSAGSESYRKDIANFYTRHSIEVEKSDIMITTGGSEAIIFAFLSCLNEEEEVIIPEPFYANYNGFAVEAGAKVVAVSSYIDNDFALPSIDEFEKKITNKTKAILICNPNNPTGHLYTREELEQLRDLALKHDIFLISDEVYREFCYDGYQHTSVMELEGLENHAIMIDSISKRYSMCGARLGCIVTKNREVLDACIRMGQARLCPPILAQIAAQAALRAPETYFQEVYNEYVARRDVMVSLLNNIEGVYCPTPRGAFYSIVELPVDDSDKFAQWILEEFTYENQTVMVSPASGFYATKGLGKNQIRIAYVLNRDELKKAAKCLEMALKEYKERCM